VTCDKCGPTGRYCTGRLVERYGLDISAVKWLRIVSADVRAGRLAMPTKPRASLLVR
jgi:hypothetical protein